MPQRGPEASQRTSLAILFRAQARVLSAPWATTSASWLARASNLFSAVTKGKPGQLGDLGGAPRTAYSVVRVQAGADRGAAQRQLVEMRQGVVDRPQGMVELRDVAGELLAQGQRRGVLQVGAADLDDVLERHGLGCQRVAQGPHLRLSRCSICSTAAICMAVGKVSLEDWLLFTSSLGWIGFLEPMYAAGQLDGAVGDHLVGVHVGLGAAAGLPDAQREMVVERSRDHLVGGLRRSGPAFPC